MIFQNIKFLSNNHQQQMLKPQKKNYKQKVGKELVSGVRISKRRVVTKEHQNKLGNIAKVFNNSSGLFQK